MAEARQRGPELRVDGRREAFLQVVIVAGLLSIAANLLTTIVAAKVPEPVAIGLVLIAVLVALTIFRTMADGDLVGYRVQQFVVRFDLARNTAFDPSVKNVFDVAATMGAGAAIGDGLERAAHVNAVRDGPLPEGSAPISDEVSRRVLDATEYALVNFLRNRYEPGWDIVHSFDSLQASSRLYGPAPGKRIAGPDLPGTLGERMRILLTETSGQYRAPVFVVPKRCEVAYLAAGASGKGARRLTLAARAVTVEIGIQVVGQRRIQTPVIGPDGRLKDVVLEPQSDQTISLQMGTSVRHWRYLGAQGNREVRWAQQLVSELETYFTNVSSTT